MGEAWCRARGGVLRLAFAPARAQPLAALRIGLALVLLAQAALVAPAFTELVLPSGLVSGSLRALLHRPGLPHLDALYAPLACTGVGEGALGAALGVAYVLALLALLVGAGTRIAAALAWLLHLVLLTTDQGTNYGADRIAQLVLFYLVWAPCGDALSLDRALRREEPRATPTARLALRVVQLQLCIVYLTSGLGKLASPGWRNGDVIWRVLMTPEYARFGFDFGWLAAEPSVAVGLGWAVVAVELGYAFLVWPRRTRRLWVLAVVALHAGIAVFMGLVVFGALMAVLTAAAFGVDAEPSR